MAGGPVTVLFTDLVSSTELIQRVGDEQALRVLRAHQRLLRDAVAVHGGQEVKWTGDGLMTTFGSSADAVRCAVAMQQTTRVRAAGERLAMRAGLHVGEALRDECDWVGASVVVARRLCDRAAAGQILCSGLVVELLGGRRAFRFGELGALALKGFAAPIPAYEVQYDRDDPAAALRRTPFMGRGVELSRLVDAAAAHEGLEGWPAERLVGDDGRVLVVPVAGIEEVELEGLGRRVLHPPAIDHHTEAPAPMRDLDLLFGAAHHLVHPGPDAGLLHPGLERHPTDTRAP